MPSLLYEIYNGDYDTTQKRDKDMHELEKKLGVEWDKVQETLGDRFTEHLLELEGERSDQQGFYFYREGFRLGVRLMLEALTSATV